MYVSPGLWVNIGGSICEHRLWVHSFFLQQYQACLVRLGWMEGKRPYSYCFDVCSFQDLFKAARWRSPRGVLVNVLDCNIIVSESNSCRLLRSLSDKYHRERHELSYRSRYELNSITTVPQQGWIEHRTTNEDWYGFEQRKQNNIYIYI